MLKTCVPQRINDARHYSANGNRIHRIYLSQMHVRKSPIHVEYTDHRRTRLDRTKFDTNNSNSTRDYKFWESIRHLAIGLTLPRNRLHTQHVYVSVHTVLTSGVCSTIAVEPCSWFHRKFTHQPSLQADLFVKTYTETYQLRNFLIQNVPPCLHFEWEHAPDIRDLYKTHRKCPNHVHYSELSCTKPPIVS